MEKMVRIVVPAYVPLARIQQANKTYNWIKLAPMGNQDEGSDDWVALVYDPMSIACLQMLDGTLTRVADGSDMYRLWHAYHDDINEALVEAWTGATLGFVLNRWSLQKEARGKTRTIASGYAPTIAAAAIAAMATMIDQQV